MLQFLKKLLGSRPVAAPVPVLVPVPAPAAPLEHIEDPLSLEDLLRWYRKREARMPASAAVYLTCRLCELLAKEEEGLGALNHQEVRLTPGGGVLIAVPHPFAAGDGRTHRGSLWHTSPELIQGRPLDARSIVFNLGTLLHECLTGARLFAADSDFGVIEAVRNAVLPDRPECIEPKLHDVLVRALMASPEHRYQTVEALRAALAPFVGGFDGKAFTALVASIAPQPPLPVEPAAPVPFAPGDESARLVYADWLEENGQPDEASWLRLEGRLAQLEGAALEAALLELNGLSAKVGPAFMATVARPAVEGCAIRFGFKCPLKWEAMQRTERAEVRHCAGCRQDVHFCTTLEKAQEVARRGGCVALDPSLVRVEGDLDPYQAGSGYLGRLA